MAKKKSRKSPNLYSNKKVAKNKRHVLNSSNQKKKFEVDEDNDEFGDLDFGESKGKKEADNSWNNFDDLDLGDEL